MYRWKDSTVRDLLQSSSLVIAGLHFKQFQPRKLKQPSDKKGLTNSLTVRTYPFWRKVIFHPLSASIFFLVLSSLATWYHVSPPQMVPAPSSIAGRIRFSRFPMIILRASFGPQVQKPKLPWTTGISPPYNWDHDLRSKKQSARIKKGEQIL